MYIYIYRYIHICTSLSVSNRQRRHLVDKRKSFAKPPGSHQHLHQGIVHVDRLKRAEFLGAFLE